jgi:hypothetical protein
LTSRKEISVLNRAKKQYLVIFAGLILLLAGSSAARADEIGNYALSDVSFVGGGTAAGSFSYDFTTSTFAAIDISTKGTVGTSNQSFTLASLVPGDFSYPTGWCHNCSPSGNFDEFALNNGTDMLWLDLLFPTRLTGPNLLLPDPFNLDVSSDLGYDCTNKGVAGCYAADGIRNGVVTGSRIPVSTPEPSTALSLLLGCFAIFAAYGMRRKSPRDPLAGIA